MDVAIYATAALVAANVADIVTTAQALSRGAREGNPVVRRLMAWFGPFWPLPKSVPAGVAVWAAWVYPTDLRLAIVAGLLAAVYTVVAIHNHQLHR